MSNRIHCTQSSLDLFTPPAQDVAYKDGEWVEAKPISSTRDGPITITRKSDDTTMVDLSSSWLEVQCKITKADGSAIPEEKAKTATTAAQGVVATINLPLHSMFEQIDMELNGRNVSASMNTYAFRAYVETVLTYGSDAKDSWLTAAGYYDTKNSKLDSFNSTAKVEGFEKLKSMFKLGKEVQFGGPLHLDLCHQSRLIIPGVDITLRFIRARDEFVILQANDDDEKYKLKLTDMRVWFYQINIASSLRINIEKTLTKQPALYPITRVEVKTFTVGSGVTTHEEDNLFLGRLPRRIVIGMVSNKAMTGSRTLTPFNFQHYNVTSIRLTANGQEVPFGNVKITPDKERAFTSLHGYLSLGFGTGKLFGDIGNNIAYDEWWLYGKTFFAFDLTPHRAMDCFAQPTSGNIRLQLRFKEDLNETINLIVYAEYDSEIKIDRNRNILADF